MLISIAHRTRPCVSCPYGTRCRKGERASQARTIGTCRCRYVVDGHGGLCRSRAAVAIGYDNGIGTRRSCQNALSIGRATYCATISGSPSVGGIGIGGVEGHTTHIASRLRGYDRRRWHRRTAHRCGGSSRTARSVAHRDGIGAGRHIIDVGIAATILPKVGDRTRIAAGGGAKATRIATTSGIAGIDRSSKRTTSRCGESGG